MTAGPVRSPSAGMIPPGSGMPFAILGLMWGAGALFGLVWAVGSGLQWLASGEWAPPQFGFEFVTSLLADGPETVWPSVDTTVLGGTFLVALAAVTLLIAVPLARTVGRRAAAGAPEGALATARDLAPLTRRGAAERALRLRPTLDGRRTQELADADVGVALGAHRPSGRQVWASWEDVVLSVMAPRAGKTTALAVPAVLAAPGLVVATSNKADLWAATASIRSRQGRVWTFDPQGIVGVAQSWWWNPLDAVTDVEGAQRLAGHFVQEVRGGGSQQRGGSGQDFWSSAAEDLLTSLLLAAAVSGRPITEVYRWLSDSTSPVPVGLLREHGHVQLAEGLQSRQSGAPETRDGIFETARTAAQALRNPQITAWITPPPGTPDMPKLDVASLPRTADTLYLHSKDGAGAAAPLVAALVDQVLRAATVVAERAGGRLDPPMVAVLDEAANICRIADLPDLYSHFGSRGIVPVTILQSYRQGTRVWGEHGMDALWSAATVKLIGSGIDDPRLAEDLSRLVGERDVTVRSDSFGRGDHSSSLSLRKERILPPERIRALPRGTALLLATGTPAALVDLQPWFEGARSGEVSAAIAAAETSRRAPA